MKKVKIYGTLGPSCADAKTLEAMLREGMDGVRLNLSHTTLEASVPLVEALHRAGRACGVEPELLIDLQGPELRIGNLPAPLSLRAGERINAARLLLPPELSALLHRCPPGQALLLDDGKLLLTAEPPETDETLPLRVVRGGLLERRKSVALPGCEVLAPALTETDRAQLAAARAYGVTAVMQPFVRSREDLLEVRSALNQAGGQTIRLLAKIENAAGLEKLEALIPCCEEIVIARGDLGNAMPLWALPAAQKRIAAACRAAGRDFMVVTQMLDSMTHRPVPTRAEVSDVFNAVLDGAASVMVTGETAAGDYPAQVIRYLTHTVREAEAYMKKFF